MKKEKEIINEETPDVEVVKKGINKILICLIVLVLLIGAFIVVKKLNKVDDNKKFAEEYTTVTEDNLFVYNTIEEIINIIENDTGIIYLGFPECKWCQAYVPMLNEVAKENKVEKIHYFNIYNDRKENSSLYQELVTLLDEYLDVDENSNKRIFVPEVVFVKEGKVVAHNNETSMVSGIETTDYWTETKKEELKQILTQNVKFMKTQSCTTCND